MSLPSALRARSDTVGPSGWNCDHRYELEETYRYVPDKPVSCPISALGGLEDGITRDQLEGWREQTSAGFKLRMLDGDHFHLETDRSSLLRALAEDLQAFLQ